MPQDTNNIVCKKACPKSLQEFELKPWTSGLKVRTPSLEGKIILILCLLCWRQGIKGRLEEISKCLTCWTGWREMPWRKMANLRVELGFMTNESVNARSHIAKLHMYLLFDLAVTLLRLHPQGEMTTNCWKQPSVINRGLEEIAVHLSIIEHQADVKRNEVSYILQWSYL